jgi:hypothetical protein
MAALVQIQLSPEFSGVAFSSPFSGSEGKIEGVYVELVRGHSNRLLQGFEEPHCYLSREGNAFESIDAGKTVFESPEIETSVLLSVVELFHRVSRQLGKPFLLEWLVGEEGAYLLQARPMPDPRVPSEPKQFAVVRPQDFREHLLPGLDRHGLKSAAMMLFKDLGWFSKPLVIIPPSIPPTDIRHRINSSDLGNRGFTVRFSHKGKMGLPRFFVRSKSEIIDRVIESRQSQWTAIVHEFIDVRHSFEMQIEGLPTAGQRESWSLAS